MELLVLVDIEFVGAAPFFFFFFSSDDDDTVCGTTTVDGGAAEASFSTVKVSISSGFSSDKGLPAPRCHRYQPARHRSQ